jgi:hypothetical protein
MVLIQVENNLLQTGQIKNVTCPNCKNRENLEYKIFGGVIRILLIPILPNKRITKVYCNSCQKEFKLNKLDDDIKQVIKYEKSKKPIAYPIWQFIGSVILITILSFGIYTGIEMNKLEKVYIREPKNNDIYKINIDGEYSTLKVSSVTKDSVLILLNKFTLNNYNGIDQININENYTTIKIFSKKELLKLYNENSIYEIVRD